MAVIREVVDSRLVLIVQTGLNDNGQPILRNRTFSRLKPEAPDADVYDIAVVLGSLQAHAINAIHRVDNGELIEQP